MLSRSVLLIWLLVLWAAPLCAADWAQVGSEDIPVQLEADQLSYDRKQSIYRASGDVRLIQGDFQVQGQELLWHQPSGRIEISGDVKLTSPDEELSGSRASYNLLEGTGTVKEGHFFLRGENIHLRGERIERRGEDRYHVSRGTFTTCDGAVPSWKFGAEELDLTLGEFARARNMIFYLGNVPSFYFPYLIYPAKTERESGLLIPSVGFSDKRGFQYSGAYYQVLGINQDATLYLDYLSRMGIGKGLEYRYIFGRDNAGEARAYHIDVDQVNDVKVDEDRYALAWRHDGHLPGDIRIVADAEYVNDDRYFDDLSEVAGEYNRDKVESFLFAEKNWDGYSLVGEARYTRDLESTDHRMLQQLPRLTFSSFRKGFGETPFYSLLDTEYTRFWRRDGPDGERLRLSPALGADLFFWQHVHINPQIAYHQNLYWGLDHDQDDDRNGIAEFSVKLHTRLERIYRFDTLRLRHSLEPEVVYRYIPDEDQQDVPDFDIHDRIEAADSIEFGLVQRLTARVEREGRAPDYREVLYLRLAQSFDLDRLTGDRGFKALKAKMKLRPADGLRLDGEARYDMETDQLQKVSLEAGLRDDHGNGVDLSYRHDKEEDIDYGAVDLRVGFLKPVYLNYRQRHDLNDNQPLEQTVVVEYHKSCWSAAVALKKQGDDHAVLFTFTMRGIGSLGNGAEVGLGGI